jgi:ornithine cyclodeaminase/alanine dehydrogenase-like protein (mu-crystallin family)
MSVTSKPVLILCRSEIAGLMRTSDYVDAVEAAFRCHAMGRADVPMPMLIRADDGAFHAKGARVELDRAYVAIKVNANFPSNGQRWGLPTIQGVIVLCDATDGSLLALMDSIEVTRRRTAAATVVAARFLARREAARIAICGCGEQGRAHVAALADVMPIERALVWDVDGDKARVFAGDMRRSLDIDVIAVEQLADATRSSDVIVTATTARTPFLTTDMVVPGTFVAAVGADSAEKSELAPQLMAGATIVADLLTQCAVMGDLHHAIDAGLVTVQDVHCELGDLVTGRKPGRTDPNQITVFDSTGTALQDVACAARIYERAVADGAGRYVPLN